jgi:hypothetical protein
VVQKALQLFGMDEIPEKVEQDNEHRNWTD